VGVCADVGGGAEVTGGTGLAEGTDGAGESGEHCMFSCVRFRLVWFDVNCFCGRWESLIEILMS
jgi:hypothetical protein